VELLVHLAGEQGVLVVAQILASLAATFCSWWQACPDTRLGWCLIRTHTKRRRHKEGVPWHGGDHKECGRPYNIAYKVTSTFVYVSGPGNR
jgi:hypothetical protein